MANKTTPLLWLMLIVLISPNASAQWELLESGKTLVLGGWIFDGLSDERRRNKGLLIDDGKISQLDASEKTHNEGSINVVRMTETQTLIPGLIDLHAHYNIDLLDQGRVEEVDYNGKVFLANGVTATWSAGEYYPERVLKQRTLIDTGKSSGPRLFASGPYFGAFRCEYNIKVSADECIGWPNDISEDEIRNEVNHWADQGVVSIKIKQATPGEMAIIIDQAHKRGLTTAAHLANYNVEYDVDLRDAIFMGLDRVEHQLTLGSGGPMSAEMPAMIDLLLKHEVFYDANLQMYGGINERKKHADTMLWTDEARFFTDYSQALLEERGDPPPESDAEEFAQRVVELKALFDAGGEHLLIVGTDEPVYTSLLPGFAYHRELLAMTYAGIPPASVLKAATINGAKALGVEDKLGSIEIDKLADFVIVEGNPLDDIKHARNVVKVFKGGVEYDPAALLRSAERRIGPSGPDDHDDWILRLRPLRRIDQTTVH